VGQFDETRERTQAMRVQTSLMQLFSYSEYDLYKYI
jgi:hypothetical protein